MSDSPTDRRWPDMAADLVGPGCAAYAKAVPDGPGSVSGMAEDPVAVAASNNPLLTTLVAAVSGKVNPKVNLVDTLNGGEFTVFAPVDDAFAEIPPATLKALAKPADAETLTKVLTYHVLPGQIAPDAIVGTHKTVEGEDLEVTGSGDDLKVNGANVICGGVTHRQRHGLPHRRGDDAAVDELTHFSVRDREGLPTAAPSPGPTSTFSQASQHR